MRDIAVLRSAARRSYETGRLLTAARVAAIVVPLTGVSAWETGALLACGLAGTSLLALTIGMRWWHRRGVEAVSAGLQAGVAPTLAALMVCRVAPSCPPTVALTLCATAGLISGAIVGRAAVLRSAASWQQWALVAVVAGLTAMLGCIGLGLGAAIGAATAIALGTAATFSRPFAA
jgi:hypothetical protein